MAWTESDYPAEMNNLDPMERSRAIDVGNAIVAKGYSEAAAIAVAIREAARWFASRPEAQPAAATPRTKTTRARARRPIGTAEPAEAP